MKNVLLFVVAAIILWWFFKDETPTAKESEPTPNYSISVEHGQNTLPAETKALTDEEYVQSLNSIWDAKQLDKVDGFPQYEDYRNSLDTVLDLMNRVTKSGSFPKVEKLKSKFQKSKKYQDAVNGHLKYGQPISKSDLTVPCEYYLEANMNDPSSLDIISSQIEGQSKNGWLVLVKYRGKNAFGGLVVNVTQFELQYNETAKVYDVINAN